VLDWLLYVHLLCNLQCHIYCNHTRKFQPAFSGNVTISDFYPGCPSKQSSEHASSVLATLQQQDQCKTCSTCITPISELYSHKNKSHILLAIMVQETPIYYNIKGNSIHKNADFLLFRICFVHLHVNSSTLKLGAGSQFGIKFTTGKWGYAE
jgi:hypothetical protein